mmetsp:Transcript_41752/g.99039  ORF Transcript_41752/g.99039 Transcript_41752/m.99039 type:complete len:111 (+) Transcript_41752:612-944(+)
MNMFLPFLLGVLHRYGWFKWVKKEWVTFTFWKQKFTRWIYGEPPTEVSGPDRPAAGAATEKGGAQQPPDPDDGEGADQPRVAGPGGAAGCGEGAEVRRRKGGGDPPPSER